MRVRAVGDGGIGRLSRVLARPAPLVAVQASQAALWAEGVQEPERPAAPFVFAAGSLSAQSHPWSAGGGQHGLSAAVGEWGVLGAGASGLKAGQAVMRRLRW